MIHSAKDLSPDQKLVVESLLGRTIADSEEIMIGSFPAPAVSSDRGNGNRTASRADRRHICEVIAENMRDVPAEEFAKLPRDGASEHDHYLYGSPKRNA
jgi:hypothetical protein